MGLWQRLLARVQRQNPQHLQRWFMPWGASGVTLTADEALSLSAVWACIDAIAKSLASCRWNIYLPEGPPEARRRTRLDDDPLAWLLNTRPNPEMTGVGFREAMLYVAIPHGNAYAEIQRDLAGRVSALWPLDHERVNPKRLTPDGELLYEYLQPEGERVLLSGRDVFHLRGPGLNGLMGENLIARAAKSLSVAAATERSAGSFFGGGAVLAGYIETGPGKLSPERRDELKKDFDEKRGTPEKQQRPLFLEAGWKYVPSGVDPQKSQLVEGRQFSVEEICRWFGVPPHKVQHLLHATFSNIEHQSIEFVRDALTPWARRLEQEADYKLFRQDRGPWRYTSIDTAPLSHGDLKSRIDALSIGTQSGIMNRNEAREQLGLNDAGDEGDVFTVQSNLTTIQKLMEAPAPGAKPERGPPEPEDAEVVEEPATNGAAAKTLSTTAGKLLT